MFKLQQQTWKESTPTSWKWETPVWVILEGVVNSHIKHTNPTSTALLKPAAIPTVEDRAKFRSPSSFGDVWDSNAGRKKVNSAL